MTLLFAVLMISTSSLFAQNAMSERFESVSNEEFKEALETGDYILLDVRTVEEYSAGNIEGAKLLDFNGEHFDQALADMPKDHKYLIYCASGTRSKLAMEKMKEIGFKYVLELDNGFNGWE